MRHSTLILLILSTLVLVISSPTNADAPHQDERGAIIQQANATQLTLADTLELPAPVTLQAAYHDNLVASGGRDGRVYLNTIGSPPALGIDLPTGTQITALAFSPDGTRLAVGITDFLQGQLIMLDAQAGTTLFTVSIGDQVIAQSLAFSQDGMRLAVAGADIRDLRGILGIWDVQSGAQVHDLAGEERSIEATIFTPDGATLIAGDIDGVIGFWDTESGTQQTTLQLDPPEPITALALAPDGVRLAAATAYGGLWLADGATLIVNQTLDSPLTTLAFNLTGDLLVAGAEDGSLHLLDVEGNLAHSLAAHTQPVIALSFSSDGRQLVTAGQEGQAAFFTAPPDQVPTATATLEPTATLTTVPTDTPTLLPTETPTATPTLRPVTPTVTPPPAAIAPVDDLACETGDEVTIPLEALSPLDRIGVEVVDDQVAQVIEASPERLRVACLTVGVTSIAVQVDVEAAQSFQVTVTQGNRLPALVAEPTDQRCTAGDRLVLDMTTHDLDDDAVQVMVVADNPAAVALNQSDPTRLVIDCQAAGQATLTIMLDDRRGERVDYPIRMTVQALPADDESRSNLLLVLAGLVIAGAGVGGGIWYWRRSTDVTEVAHLDPAYYPIVRALLWGGDLQEAEYQYRELVAAVQALLHQDETWSLPPQLQREEATIDLDIIGVLPDFVTQRQVPTTEPDEARGTLQNYLASVPLPDVTDDPRIVAIYEIATQVTELLGDFIERDVAPLSLDCCQPQTLPDEIFCADVGRYLEHLRAFWPHFLEMTQRVPALAARFQHNVHDALGAEDVPPVGALWRDMLAGLHHHALQRYVEGAALSEAHMQEIIAYLDQGDRNIPTDLLRDAPALALMLDPLLRRIARPPADAVPNDVWAVVEADVRALQLLLVAHGLALMALRTLANYFWRVFPPPQIVCLPGPVPESLVGAIRRFQAAVHVKAQIAYHWNGEWLEIRSLLNVNAAEPAVGVMFDCQCDERSFDKSVDQDHL